MQTVSTRTARAQPISRGGAPTAWPRHLVRAASTETSPASVTTPSSVPSYFIASNVFKVKPESANDFEETWRTRESHLKEMPGFVRFAMLKCVNVPGKYISQTTWTDKAAFENWTKSQQFKASHGGGKSESGEAQPSKRPPVMTMLEGPPQFEGFETVTVTE